METVEDADRCIKYLNRSVLEGRLITVEKVQASVTSFNWLLFLKKPRTQLFMYTIKFLFLSLSPLQNLKFCSFSEMLPDKLWQQVWSL